MKEANIPNLPFYFIRHGETDWNLKHKIMGSTDIELNNTGIEQAYSSAYILADIEVSVIFSSPLKRAYQTAQIISEVSELEIKLTDSFKERNWGSIEGNDYKNNLSFFTNDNLPPDGEKYIDFQKRIIEGTKQVLLSEYGYPLIVSHGGVFKVLAQLLTGRIDLSCKNCEIFFFSPPTLTNSWEIIEV